MPSSAIAGIICAIGAGVSVVVLLALHWRYVRWIFTQTMHCPIHGEQTFLPAFLSGIGCIRCAAEDYAEKEAIEAAKRRPTPAEWQAITAQVQELTAKMHRAEGPTLTRTPFPVFSEEVLSEFRENEAARPLFGWDLRPVTRVLEAENQSTVRANFDTAIAVKRDWADYFTRHGGIVIPGVGMTSRPPGPRLCEDCDDEAVVVDHGVGRCVAHHNKHARASNAVDV